MKIIKPMLLTSDDNVFSDADWIFEPKYDGYRLLVGNKYSYTKFGTVTTTRLPELQFDLGYDVLLDGELITPSTNAPDNHAGSTSRFHGNMEQPIYFMAFDLLEQDHASIMTLPIERRKELLSKVIRDINSPYIKQILHIPEEGERLFSVMKENNMEGMIAKKKGTPYLPGIRSPDWRNIICWTQHDVFIKKITLRPLSAQLFDSQSNYIGTVWDGFTKEIKSELYSKSPPFSCKVKARGWTSGHQLRLPQIIEIY
ncbi:ATP-dependent DNA ligase [Domibacillus epiphyticus]|uniref:ATP-dependent DNA ligase family profile domain-containing protein n=1 Tax=Domibacillus epiphyticus TaxID=1714355 RepID=A0A1V2A479_9BACI|nr:hypothetical protein [Domibacillus epiphyticus]OMP65730.1 hypothetical protein BTO28_15805 [Domibacillus epiphyticus]